MRSCRMNISAATKYVFEMTVIIFSWGMLIVRRMAEITPLMKVIVMFLFVPIRLIFLSFLSLYL